jgi:hypothetical protein
MIGDENCSFSAEGGQGEILRLGGVYDGEAASEVDMLPVMYGMKPSSITFHKVGDLKPASRIGLFEVGGETSHQLWLDTWHAKAFQLWRTSFVALAPFFRLSFKNTPPSN